MMRPARSPRIRLAAPAPMSIEIPRKIAELNHMAIAVAQAPTRDRELELRGELAIDFNKLVHVHAIFPGRIMEIAAVDDVTNPAARDSRDKRPLGFMDRVTKNQPMVVLWSKDFGEKKSELVDALANLRLDKEAYDRIKVARSAAAPLRKPRCAKPSGRWRRAKSP